MGGLLKRFVRLVWGDTVEPELRPLLAVAIFVFVIGEMLWVPTSQAVAAGLAPPDLRGAYMGAFSSMGAVGFALAPFTGLLVRDAGGDSAMWAFFAAMSIVGAAVGALTLRIAYARRFAPGLVRL